MAKRQTKIEIIIPKTPKPRDPSTINTSGLRPIQKGEVRNPTGIGGHRARKKLLTEEYKTVLESICPEDPEGRTYAQLIAVGQAKAAASGFTPAAKEIADRTEGTVAQNHINTNGNTLIQQLSAKQLDDMILSGELPEELKQLEGGS